MQISTSDFGKTADGKSATLYSLSNTKGMTVNITNFGGIVTAIYTPDKNGKFANVCLGFDCIEPYYNNPAYFGALIGRYANRIKNGAFELDNKKYQLSKNDAQHHLHGGTKGFDKQLWSAEIFYTENSVGITLRHLSLDGDEGYPGNCDVTATYELNNENEILLSFHAECDKPTPINLTQHSYFNLAGYGDILNHTIMINAERFAPINENQIPTGEVKNVSNTPLDFLQPKTLDKYIFEDDDQLDIAKGFNHYYFVKKHNASTLGLAARAYEPTSGRVLEIFTQEPGVQFYTAGFLAAPINNKFTGYGPYSGFCFEPQHCPNALNYTFLSNTILRPGEIYRTSTRYRFLVEK